MDAAKPMCVKCDSILTRWFGVSKKHDGRPKYQCLDCACVFTIDGAIISGHYTTPQKQMDIVAMMVEGNSIRGISRLTDVCKPAVLQLLRDVGEACSRFEDTRLRNLVTQRVQCDEMWSFVHTKRKNLPAELLHVFGLGDVWTWLAIDADSRLVVTWRMGPRDSSTAEGFMRDVASRFLNKVVLTTDGFRVYMRAVGVGFSGDAVDHEMLTGVYRTDRKMSSTSYAERQNLTMRMGMRRFMRRTNGFSKSLRNHAAACGLYFAHYNFCRIHKTLRVTPAMEAGIENRVWSIKELIALVDGYSSQVPRLFAGPNAQQFCLVCGQVMSVERRDSVCSRRCQTTDVHHMVDVA